VDAFCFIYLLDQRRKNIIDALLLGDVVPPFAFSILNKRRGGKKKIIDALENLTQGTKEGLI
jgi:hypothetical protein